MLILRGSENSVSSACVRASSAVPLGGDVAPRRLRRLRRDVQHARVGDGAHRRRAAAAPRAAHAAGQRHTTHTACLGRLSDR